jgi:cation transport ATPase
MQEIHKDSVIMVGDGLNDIPCLQEAGIGISINAKSELNINAADVVILSENLHKILALIRFLRKGNLFIKINLFWAFAYNVVMMPIVAGAFYSFGVYVSPVWSAIAMSMSSLLVVAFSHILTFLHYDDSLDENKKSKSNPEVTIEATGSNRQSLISQEELN